MRPIFLLLASCFLTVSSIRSRAADAVTPCAVDCVRLARLEKQAERAESLERELAAARAEITRLNGIPPVRPERGGPVWVHPAVQKAVDDMPAPRVLDGLKPVTSDEVVDPLELLAHFAADPKAAEARYAKRTFELRGIVAEVDKTLFAAPYQVVFRLPGTMLRGVCEMYPPDHFGKVYVTEDRQRVVGEASGRKTTFATAGTEVRLRVRCEGLKAGAVRFDRCGFVPVR